MSARAFRKLPGWVEPVLLPILNLFLAFAVLGFLLVFLYAEPNTGNIFWAPLHYAGEYFRLLFSLMDSMITGSISTPREVEIAGRTLLKAPNFRPLSNVIFYATTLTFTGLAVALAFRAGHFNIGGEGQMMLGGIAIGICVAILTTSTGENLSAYGWVESVGKFPILVFLFLLAGLFGALWIALPAFLQAYRGSHIVITTIMFNAIAGGILTYVLKIEGFIKRPLASELATPQAPEVFRLPSFPLPNFCQGVDLKNNALVTMDSHIVQLVERGATRADGGLIIDGVFQSMAQIATSPPRGGFAPTWLEAMPFLKSWVCMPASGDNGNVLFFVAVLAAVLVAWFLRRTTLGFGVRTTGLNTNAARSAGMDPRRITVIALCLSGALAGFAAMNHVLSNGSAFSLKEGFSAQLGFAGISVALLARNNPLIIPITAFVFGMLIQGGVAVQQDPTWNGEINASISEAIQGLIVLFIGAFVLLFYSPIQWLWNRIGPAVEEETER